MPRGKYKQRGNGQGSIIEIKAKEGKPRPKRRFRVRVTIGWEMNMDTGKMKQVLKDLGYYESRSEAEDALSNYRDCPYDLDTKDMTFKECFESWFGDYKKQLSGVSSERTVINAFEYMTPLYNKRMRDIKQSHLQDTINNAVRVQTRGKDKGKVKEASADTKSRMKSVFNLVFDWALNHDIVDRNYERGFKLEKKIMEQREAEKGVIHIFSN